MERSFLDDFDVPDVFKAFSITMMRMIVENPDILLIFNEKYKKDGWKELYDGLTDERIELMSQNITDSANQYNWGRIEETYRAWGRFGWITNQGVVPWGFWEHCPTSQRDADACVSSAIIKFEIIKIRIELERKTRDVSTYKEAMKCFDNKCYKACATLLISLIDGELIKCKSSLTPLNKKTGAVAGMRMVKDVAQNNWYGLPGWFRLELINYEEYISTLFKSASGFAKEPNNINRNYIHHGMSKRKVLKRDCIKLLIAYHRTLSLVDSLKW